MEVQLEALSTSALDGKWSASRPSLLVPGTHWLINQVGPRAVLDYVRKREISLSSAGDRTPPDPLVVQPVAQLLYRLSYRGNFINIMAAAAAAVVVIVVVLVVVVVVVAAAAVVVAVTVAVVVVVVVAAAATVDLKSNRKS